MDSEFCAQAIYQLSDIEKIDNGLFTTTAFQPKDSEDMYIPVEYCTYNRFIGKEIGVVLPGMKKSYKIQIAKEILDLAREQEKNFPNPTQPLIIDISNSIAKVVESFKLPDSKKRIALRRDFIIQELQKRII